MQEIYNPNQMSFADLEADALRESRLQHSDKALNAMQRLPDELVQTFCLLCEPFYHTRNGHEIRKGRPCAALQTMVRIHLLQLSLNLSDKEMESLLLTDLLVRRFCQVPLGRGLISDTTILRFRRTVETHGLGRQFFEATKDLAQEEGALDHKSVAVDATFIDGPDSTKNKDHARDPEMASGKKANTWHFGLKFHIAICAMSGLVYNVVGGPANEHDITRLHDVLDGDEEHVFADSGYTGCAKRPEIVEMNLENVKWHIAAKPSAWKKLLSLAEKLGGEFGAKLTEDVELTRAIEHAKASVRSKVEWVFLWIKRIFGYSETRYRGLAKNLNRVITLATLYNWHCLELWRAKAAAS